MHMLQCGKLLRKKWSLIFLCTLRITAFFLPKCASKKIRRTGLQQKTFLDTDSYQCAMIHRVATMKVVLWRYIHNATFWFSLLKNGVTFYTLRFICNKNATLFHNSLNKPLKKQTLSHFNEFYLWIIFFWITNLKNIFLW